MLQHNPRNTSGQLTQMVELMCTNPWAKVGSTSIQSVLPMSPPPQHIIPRRASKRIALTCRFSTTNLEMITVAKIIKNCTWRDQPPELLLNQQFQAGAIAMAESILCSSVVLKRISRSHGMYHLPAQYILTCNRWNHFSTCLLTCYQDTKHNINYRNKHLNYNMKPTLVRNSIGTS